MKLLASLGKVSDQAKLIQAVERHPGCSDVRDCDWKGNGLWLHLSWHSAVKWKIIKQIQEVLGSMQWCCTKARGCIVSPMFPYLSSRTKKFIWPACGGKVLCPAPCLLLYHVGRTSSSDRIPTKATSYRDACQLLSATWHKVISCLHTYTQLENRTVVWLVIKHLKWKLSAAAISQLDLKKEDAQMKTAVWHAGSLSKSRRQHQPYKEDLRVGRL